MDSATLKSLLRAVLAINGLGDLLLAANPGNFGADVIKGTMFQNYFMRKDAAPLVVETMCAAFAVHGFMRLYAALHIGSAHGRRVGMMSWLGEWLFLAQLRAHLDPVAQPLLTAPVFWGGALALAMVQDDPLVKPRD